MLIDPNASPDYKRHVKNLRKKYRHIEEDLADAYGKIAQHPKTACAAAAVPGYGGAVWKYRCESRDMKRGLSRGFRILVKSGQSGGVMHPFAVYTHDQYAVQPPAHEVRAWLENLAASLRGLPLIDEE